MAVAPAVTTQAAIIACRRRTQDLPFLKSVVVRAVTTRTVTTAWLAATMRSWRYPSTAVAPVVTAQTATIA